jgi:hypothetical protein
MSWEAWFTLLVVLATVALLVRDTVAPVLAVVGADIALLVSGVIDTGEAFAGFGVQQPGADHGRGALRACAGG